MAHQDDDAVLALRHLVESIVQLNCLLNAWPTHEPTQRGKDELEKLFDQLATDAERFHETPLYQPDDHRLFQQPARTQRAACQKLYDSAMIMNSAVVMAGSPLDPAVGAQFAADLDNYLSARFVEIAKMMIARDIEDHFRTNGMFGEDDQTSEEDDEVIGEDDQTSEGDDEVFEEDDEAIKEDADAIKEDTAATVASDGAE